MAIDYSKVIQGAQTVALDPNYMPEESTDLPFFQSLWKQTDDAIEDVLDTVSSKEVYANTAAITGNGTVGPTSLVTVAGSNYAAQGFMLMMLVEHNVGSASGGSVDFTVNWTANGAPAADTVSLALSGGAQANINSGVFFLFADIGTNITWEYTVSGFGTGTANVRFVVSLTTLI